MEEFSARQLFAVPSFDLEVEEQQIFDKFYHFLDNSGVAEIIKKAIRNDTKKGGRPNVNFYNLFAAVMYGFSRGRSTVRDLADACGHDIRFIEIMQQVRPSYSTIANFINSVMVEYNENVNVVHFVLHNVNQPKCLIKQANSIGTMDFLPSKATKTAVFLSNSGCCNTTTFNCFLVDLML